MTQLKKLWNNEDGATAIEYGLIAAADRGCYRRRSCLDWAEACRHLYEGQ